MKKNGKKKFGIHLNGIGSAQYDWTNEELNNDIKTENNGIMVAIESWFEQRNYSLNFAMQALEMSDNMYEIELYQQIMNEWKLIEKPMMPFENNNNNNNNNNMYYNLSDFMIVNNVSQTFNVLINNRTFVIEFNQSN